MTSIDTLPERCADCPVRQRGAPFCWRQMRSQLNLVRVHGTFHQLRKGEILFRQGDPITGWWLVHRGQILEYVVDDAGREQITRMAPAGSPTGLCGFRLAPGYSGSARAGRQGAEVYAIGVGESWRLIRENPDLACALLVGMVEEICFAQNKLQKISTLPARATVASILLATTECSGDGQSQVTLTRGEIASMAGLAVETVVRVLGEFRSQELIQDGGYASIELLDPCGLHRVSLALDSDAQGSTGSA